MQGIKRIFLLTLISIVVQVNLFAQLSMPEISSVSVHPVDSTIIIKWKSPDPSENIIAHGVSRLEYPGSVYPYTLIGSEQPSPINSFTDTEQRIIDYIHDDMSSRIYIYRILARKNAQETALSHGHLTIKFRGVYDNCTNAFDLRWSPYRMIPIDSNSKEINDENHAEYKKAKAFNNDVEYEVWGHKGASLSLASASKLSDKTKNQNIIIEHLDENSDYQIFLKCILPNGDTATSHQISLNTNNRRAPAFINIDSVQTINGSIKLTINLDRTSELDTFALFRSDITNKPVRWFYNKEVPSIYTDTEGLSLGQVYSYKIASYRCGKIDVASDSANNILLFTTPNDQKVRVQWTNVPDLGLNRSYELERETTLGKSSIDLSFVPGNQFLDESVSGLLCEGPQNVAYKIIADNGKTVSISDTRYAKLSPIITMPNAINPLRGDISSSLDMNCSPKMGIARNEFGPVIDMSYDSYRVILEIFNRSGIKIYGVIKEFSDNYDAFWNGNDINGKMVNEGAYFYNVEISFKNATQSPIIKRGTVTVIRE